MNSFGRGMNVAVIGAGGGIGAALSNSLAQCPEVSTVFRLRRSARPGDEINLDLEDEASIETAAATIEHAVDALHLVIVATGTLHDGPELQPEKSLSALSEKALQRAFRINAAGPALVAKHFLPLLARDRKSVFAALSARVGSIEDNRLGGWYAYRASKAALNMLIKTLSIELARKRPQALCVGLHPGTVNTALSRPFQRAVPAGDLFTPARAADHLLRVLDRLTPADTGGLYAWDGSRIPY